MSIRGHLVLLVDDDIPILTLMRNLIQEMLPACKCVACSNIQTAIDVLRQQGPFDLVVTDINLKDGSGYELLDVIRNGGTAGPTGTPAAVPVAAVCGEPLEPSEAARFAFATLKPFDVLPFIAKLAATLGQYSPRSA